MTKQDKKHQMIQLHMEWARRLSTEDLLRMGENWRHTPLANRKALNEVLKEQGYDLHCTE